MKSTLEECLDSIICKIHSSDRHQIYEGLKELDKLFYDLCVLANPNNSSNIYRRCRSSSPKSFKECISLKHKYSKSSSSVSTSASSNQSYKYLYSPAMSSTSSQSSYSSENSAVDPQQGANGTSVTRKWKIPTSKHPIFGDFVSLQESFEYNMAAQLLGVLRNSMDHSRQEHGLDPVQTSLLLKNLQGCLLLHPKSRIIFAKDYNLAQLLNLLDYTVNSDIVIACIPVLVSTMVRNVRVIRTFEELQGPKIICDLLKAKAKEDSTMSYQRQNRKPGADKELERIREVQVKVLEFLFFYLIPEAPGTGASQNESDESYGMDGIMRRSTESKTKILNRYLNKEVTDSLVKELLESKPFGDMNICW